MTLTQIKKVLTNHCIEYKMQSNQVAALETVVLADGTVSGEWALFDENSTVQDLRDWLGY